MMECIQQMGAYGAGARGFGRIRYC
ncbi:protein of unknown function [Candidatus Filomicrobium marinum]|uniref:Uncharacterized protein n=1 Tax=Candidatus Filomicrobium marinum TaxID=1608628 RepID=A0A0D6JJH1_9HYPH|nr:protein of unknown function [Candidatus Filomicrobium marinum]CPR22108.1 protein of unknown function [Candidatus Filomicrobium marinum]